MSALKDRTVQPPDVSHRAEFEHVAEVLAEHDALHPALLISPDGAKVELPAPLYDVLRRAALTMAKGMGVTLQSANAELTTQQAADLLGIARPTLVRLLERDEIPFHTVGRHRRVELTDLLAYDARVRRQREALLVEMAMESADDGLDDETDGLTLNEE
ncbi:helix-turn-helix domain-containing protein [Amycolatopsis sp. NPDC051903]|uniref:helix-turn-helix domain-containing protein n=1 Tax=Amycolatopsis sp. NPDC051903 TaxID=3363936 RepID=UPI00379FCE46